MATDNTQEPGNAKPIIILAGPPGAGKSTVAQHLATLLPGPVSYIEGDKFWSFLTKGFEMFERSENFTTIMTSMTVAAIPYARRGYTVVLDFCIPPWFLKTAKKLAESRNIDIDYIVLRPARAVCAARGASRTEGAITDYTIFDNLYASFDAIPAHIINDDESSAETVAEKIKSNLDRGMYRLA